MELKSVKYKVLVDVYMDVHEEFVPEVTRIGVQTAVEVEAKLREPLYLSVYRQVASKVEETLYGA